jgi:predicted metalloprotease with PDZ domain
LSQYYENGFSSSYTSQKTGLDIKTVCKYFHELSDKIEKAEMADFLERQKRDWIQTIISYDFQIAESIETLGQINLEIEKSLKEKKDVPIDTAKAILKELVEKGRVSRPWIGITSMKITRHLERYYRLPVSEGALVIQIEPFSPADNAGMRKGDIIQEIDKNKVEEPAQISEYIHKKQVGNTIALTVNRNGKLIQISLQLEENAINYNH